MIPDNKEYTSMNYLVLFINLIDFKKSHFMLSHYKYEKDSQKDLIINTQLTHISGNEALLSS